MTKYGHTPISSHTETPLTTNTLHELTADVALPWLDMKVDLFLGLVVGLLLVVGAGECTTPQQQRQHTHWSSHISGEEQLALQQTQTTTHTTVLLTPLTHTSSLQFTPLLPTTIPTLAPLVRPSVEEMAVMVFLDLQAPQDLQGYLVQLEHPVWQQSTYIMFSHPLQTPHYCDSIHPNTTPSVYHTCWTRSDLHLLGEDLLPNSGRD